MAAARFLLSWQIADLVSAAATRWKNTAARRSAAAAAAATAVAPAAAAPLGDGRAIVAAEVDWRRVCRRRAAAGSRDAGQQLGLVAEVAPAAAVVGRRWVRRAGRVGRQAERAAATKRRRGKGASQGAGETTARPTRHAVLVAAAVGQRTGRRAEDGGPAGNVVPRRACGRPLGVGCPRSWRLRRSRRRLTAVCPLRHGGSLGSRGARYRPPLHSLNAGEGTWELGSIKKQQWRRGETVLAAFHSRPQVQTRQLRSQPTTVP